MFLDLALFLKRSKQWNQIFHYTRCITPNGVLSLRARFCVIALAGNTVFFEEMLQRWQAAGSTVSNLTGSIFVPHTAHSLECINCIVFFLK